MAIERNDLEQLAIELANAKDVEANAKQARIIAEKKLADALGGKDTGSASYKCGRISVTVKRGYNYTIDEPVKFAAEHPDFVRMKPELLVRAYEACREDHPELFAKLAAHVTVTPKKASVELKL